MSYLPRWSPIDDEVDDESCGAPVDDDRYWYMGYTECLRANIAFSLYGILKGNRDRGCRRSTFINSFFTTHGIEAFTQAMETAGVSFSDESGNGGMSSKCTVFSEKGEQGNQNGDDSYIISRGAACSGRNFVMKIFEGGSCNEKGLLSMTDTLKDFNHELNEIDCVAIYDRSSAESYSDDANDDNANESLDLLLYSKACDVRESKQCPDPEDVLLSYKHANARSYSMSLYAPRERAKKAISGILFLLGIFLIGMAAIIFMKPKKSKRAVSISSTQSSTSGKSSVKRSSWWKRIGTRSKLNNVESNDGIMRS